MRVRIELHKTPDGTDLRVCEDDDGVEYARIVGRFSPAAAGRRKVLLAAFALAEALEADGVFLVQRGQRDRLI